MDKHISALMSVFDSFEEQIVAFDNNKAIYLNQAATAVFKTEALGASMADIFGGAQADMIAKSTHSSARLDGVVVDGRIYNIRTEYIEEILLLILTPDSETDTNFLVNHAIAAIGLQFKNYLNVLMPAIKSLPSMLPGYEDEKLTKYLAIIRHNCHKLQRLSNNIVDFAGFANNEAAFSPESGDIVHFCRQLSDEIRPITLIKNIDVRFQTSVDSLIIDFDADKIKRMLLNLISNSMKNTRDGNIITIKLSKSHENVFINVTDLGRGMSAETLGSTFKRFPQTHNSLSGPEYRMGLTLVSEIARLHGGAVALESREDSGVSVTISLPLDSTEHNYFKNAGVEYDYTGGFSPLLVELSDALPYNSYISARNIED